MKRSKKMRIRKIPGTRLEMVISPDMRLDWLTREEREKLTAHVNEVMNKEFEIQNAHHKFMDDLVVAARAEVKKTLSSDEAVTDQWDILEFSYLFHIATSDARGGCRPFYAGEMDEFMLADVLGVPIPSEVEGMRAEELDIEGIVAGRTSRIGRQVDAICEKLGVTIEEGD